MNRSLTLSLVATITVAVVVAALLQSGSPTPGTSGAGDTSPPVPIPPSDAATVGRVSPELAAQWMAIESREQLAAESLWSPEISAQSHGAVLERFWDALNRATERLAAAAQLPFRRLILPSWNAEHPEIHGIVVRSPSGETRDVDPSAWVSLLQDATASGWSLLQCELRHSRFDPPTSGRPAKSRFHFTAHLTRVSPPARADLTGDIDIVWASSSEAAGATPAPDTIDARSITWRSREGPPAFSPLLSESITLPRNSLSIDPVVVHDLDGDGFAEILLIARNQLYRRDSQGAYHSGPIASHPPEGVSAAVLGDFNGDGSPDLLMVTLTGLELQPGSPDARFQAQRRIVWPSPPEVRYPMVLASGDLDNDGDLDVFLGQYKEPYEGGSSPTPFHAANDGNPSFLLINDGAGRFADATPRLGIGLNRQRRVYSASFFDFDRDGDLDLVTVSDFAGLDLYRNDGKSGFQSVATSFPIAPQAFGMAHTLADFNRDGFPDLLMVGMNSPTVERLEHLGLIRTDSHQDSRMRSAMTFGNRLFLGNSGGGFAESDFGDSVARSGWSWGCASPDIDNDGFPDVAIVNGLETRETVQDYESEYWLHDQHVGVSADNPAAYLYFKAKIARTRGRGMSYGGYEKNRFYMNRDGRRFDEVAHLFGVALEQDSRNAVAEDLDGDGRMDLIVTTYENWPNAQPTLRVYRNTLETPENAWIGFRFPDGPTDGAPPGTTVTVISRTGVQARVLVNGDSYRSQHSTSVHFGLGADPDEVTVTIRWPDGTTRTLERPPTRRWHALRKPTP